MQVKHSVCSCPSGHPKLRIEHRGISGLDVCKRFLNDLQRMLDRPDAIFVNQLDFRLQLAHLLGTRGEHILLRHDCPA
ncbi:MAG: hypothetical protein P3W94_001735 [Paracoccus sp. (in: a-proteobacteria)]|nr:hypothetical protein [Paracoccus sp. (in: a-proteobacteria)]